MEISSIIKQSFKSLAANKLRSFFSILGIVVGVLAVVIILSMGKSLKGMVMNEIEALGPNILSITVKIPGAGQIGTLRSMAAGVKITTLKNKDIEDLKDIDRFPYIKRVMGQVFGQEWANYENKEKKVMLYGCSPDFIHIMRTMKVEQGRFFNDNENDGLAKVVVLGNGLKEDLFGDSDPIGKKVKIKGLSFKVVGVLEPYGGFPAVGGIDMNDFAFVPLQTAFKSVLGIDYMSEIDVEVEGSEYFDQAIAEISRLMRKNHGISDPEKDDFEITTMEQVLSTVNDTAIILDLLLGFLAVISLVVGGVGIMNIMLVSVNERTKEIGLRKAIGASKSDILNQFLVESIVVTGLGGVVGIVLGIIISILSSYIVQTQAIANWPVTVSWLAITIAFVISMIIGLVFGLYPARKAASLDPIRAIKDE